MSVIYEFFYFSNVLFNNLNNIVNRINMNEEGNIISYIYVVSITIYLYIYVYIFTNLSLVVSKSPSNDGEKKGKSNDRNFSSFLPTNTSSQSYIYTIYLIWTNLI